MFAWLFARKKHVRKSIKDQPVESIVYYGKSFEDDNGTDYYRRGGAGSNAGARFDFGAHHVREAPTGPLEHSGYTPSLNPESGCCSPSGGAASGGSNGGSD